MAGVPSHLPHFRLTEGFPGLVQEHAHFLSRIPAHICKQRGRGEVGDCVPPAGYRTYHEIVIAVEPSGGSAPGWHTFCSRLYASLICGGAMPQRVRVARQPPYVCRVSFMLSHLCK